MQFKAQTNSADPAVLMLVSKKKKRKEKECLISVSIHLQMSVVNQDISRFPYQFQNSSFGIFSFSHPGCNTHRFQIRSSGFYMAQ